MAQAKIIEGKYKWGLDTFPQWSNGWPWKYFSNQGCELTMKRWYIVRIDRPGFADLPELARCESPEAAAALVIGLLKCGDTLLRSVTVAVEQLPAAQF